MIWSDWGEFLAMGGYGLYVWGSVLMVAISLVIEIISVRRRRREVFARAAQGRSHE